MKALTLTRAIHPGEILKEELLTPRGISQAELARSINVSVRRVNDICQGKRSITPDTALRLALYFNLGSEGVEFWMNLQHNYEKRYWKSILAGQEKEIRKQVHSLPRSRANQFKSLLT